LIGGKPITRWKDVANASQKERDLIVKASGFHEEAWGSRSVTLGNDVSRSEWQAAIEKAVDSRSETFYVIQHYHKPMRIRHEIFQPDGTAMATEGRVRLCPYYFVTQETVELGAILATVCPMDKKIIHGMSDAVLMPCRVKEA
jgi:hypothetical protein